MKEVKIFFYSALGVILLVTLKKVLKMSNFRKNLAAIAVKEWQAWNIPEKVKEGNSKTMQRLRDYYIKGTNTKESDDYYVNTAWSGAFISYCMKLAGAGKNFPYSKSHSTYIVDSVKNRKQKNSKAFKAYKPSEVTIEIGDLVCRPRQDGVTYDTTGSYYSHCDIVTKINDDSLEMIGGNVSNSVSKTNVKLNHGKIIDNKYHAVIKTSL
jgi:hypothetical protein